MSGARGGKRRTGAGRGPPRRGERRASRRASTRARALLRSLLGELPEGRGKVRSVTVAVEERPAYRLERLLLDLNGRERVPAYFVRPPGARGPSPAILYSHAHGNDYVLGKDELLAGRRELASPPYAEALAARGYAVLAIDHWNFGARRGRAESELFKELLWRGQVLFGLMVHDNLRALDYLAARPDVDERRIGALGLSMGSTLSWWTAALDERVACVADLCCLSDFHALIARRGLDGHGLYYYVPGLLKHFSTAGINALIAPRPHLSLAGLEDPLTPPEGLARIDRELRRAYRAAGAPRHWRLLRYDSGHQETPAMRAEVLAFLKAHLGGGA
jgi:dienelactone hydrolase